MSTSYNELENAARTKLQEVADQHGLSVCESMDINEIEKFLNKNISGFYLKRDTGKIILSWPEAGKQVEGTFSIIVDYDSEEIAYDENEYGKTIH